MRCFKSLGPSDSGRNINVCRNNNCYCAELKNSEKQSFYYLNHSKNNGGNKKAVA